MINFENVSKWYGDIIGIMSVSFNIGTGLFGLLGPNGAGKSTIMKLILGLLRPNQGCISVRGEDPMSFSLNKGKIGYIPEVDPFYSSEKGFDIIRRYGSYHGLTGSSLTDRMAFLESFIEVKDFLNKRAGSYSKGMKQRLKLCVGILHDPDILVMDEPFNGLDPVSRAKVSKYLKTVSQRKTIIISSHILSEVESLTDHIILINNGSIFATGNILEIREKMDNIPRKIFLVADNISDLTVKIINRDEIGGIEMDKERQGIRIYTKKPSLMYKEIMKAQSEGLIDISYLMGEDEDLESVFSYVTDKRILK